MDWVDTARGISIFLVVLTHAIHWLGFAGVTAPDELRAFDAAAEGIRMPLFFTAAGLFAAKWATVGWRQLFNHKLVLLVWTFLIWQAAVFAYKFGAASILPDQQDGSLASHLLRVVVSPVRPNAELWFLWALVVFFISAKMLHKAPSWLAIGGALMLSVLWSGVVREFAGDDLIRLMGPGLSKFPMYFFFFIAASRYKEQLMRFVSNVPVVAWILVSVSWAIVIPVTGWITLLPYTPVNGLITQLFGVAAGIGSALALTRIRPVSRLGQQTLPIYLSHTTFVVGIACGIFALGVNVDGLAALAMIFSVVFIAILLGLTLQRIAGTTFLLRPPKWFKVAARSRKETLGTAQRRRAGAELNWGTMLWPLCSVLAIIVIVPLVILAPMYAAAATLVGLVILSFGLRPNRFVLLYFFVALAVVVCVPVLRIEGSGVLRLAVPVVLVSAATLVLMRTRLTPAARLVWPVAAYFILSALATASMPDDNEWAAYAITVTVAYAAVIFGTALLKMRLLKQAATVVVVIALGQALLGLFEVQFLTEPLWRGAKIADNGVSVSLRNELIASIPRAQGTFGHPLPFAFMITLGAVLVAKAQIKVLPKSVLLVVLAAGVVVSGSRNAVLLYVGLVLVTLILPSIIVRLQLVLILVVTAGVLAAPFLIDQLLTLTNSGSVVHRLGAIDSIGRLLNLRDMQQVFLGDGASSTPRLFSEGLLQRDGFEAVDNQYVLLLAQSGILGLAVILGLFIAAFRRSSGVLRLMLLGVFAEAMIFDLLTWPSTAFILWTLIAVALSAEKEKKQEIGVRETDANTQSQDESSVPAPKFALT
ncbi:acyltransferase [Pseudarthrobacter sp. PvP004]|uniref:acyltransferase n=1 Tax=Pseudarthrobacter sp. PvP004 TaxID=2817850 RepID=UPI0027DD71AA|nr:acyltransferase [Pseudarthrobacter sp. PvP004]